MNDELNVPVLDAPVPVGLDPRVASALQWCRGNGLRNLTLALPFALDAENLARIRAEPDVVSLIVEPPPPPSPADRSGVFDHPQYTWALPAVLGQHVVYVGNGNDITARMLLAVIRRASATGFVFLAFGRWHRRSLPRLAASKVRGKVGGLLAGVGDAATAVLRRTVGSATVLRFDRIPGMSRLARSPWFARQRLELAGRDLLVLLDPLRPYRRLISDGRAVPQEPARPGRVLLACPTLVAGGAERQIVATAVGLRRRGLTDLTILVGQLTKRAGNDFFRDELLREGVGVLELERATSSLAAWEQRVNSDRINWQLDLLSRQQDLPSDLVQDLGDHLAVIERLRPSVVHAWLDHSNIAAGLAALVAGVPRVLLSGRNVSPRHFSYIFKPFMEPAYRAMAERPEVILINNSQAGAADYAAWLGLPSARFEVVYNGVDAAALVRPSAAALERFRQEHGVPLQAPLIGGMFRLSPEKRPRLWLRTVARVLARRTDAHALLYGNGVMEQRLRADIKRLGLAARLRILPPTTGHGLALASFDVLLMTSLWEGTPNVALEAQSVGTPVLLTGGGGAREAVADGETGLYVASAKPRVLANTVLKLLDDPRQRAIMSAQGAAWVQRRFGLDRMLDQTLALYGMQTRPTGPDGTQSS